MIETSALIALFYVGPTLCWDLLYEGPTLLIYGGQDQSIKNPTFCRIISPTLTSASCIVTSVSLVLLYVGLSIQWSKPVYY